MNRAESARSILLSGVPAGPIGEAMLETGAYLLFARNGGTLDEMRAFTDALRERHHDLAPLIAIDQEGGAVARLREGVEPIPPMMALGATGDAELARRAGEQTAFDLRRAGCTMDLAPVLDLAIDPRNTAIGTRSFGADPLQVARLGAAFARGLREGGIICCYKHFPGHGATDVDSHEAMPAIDADEATLRARDLVPFASVAADAPAMMSAHVLMRAFDPQHPATLSHRIATDLLRGEFGFRGAFLTDCLEMSAMAAPDSSRQPVEALAAGADLLIFSHEPERAGAAAAAIEAAVDDGRIAVGRLDEAVARVRRLREAGTAPLPLDAFPPHHGIGREIARRAVTLVRGVPHADPLTSIAVSFGDSATMLQHEAPALRALTVSVDAPDVGATLDAIAQSQRRPVVLSRRAHLYAKQAEAIAAIVHANPNALVVSAAEPFDLPLFADARHLLAAYGDDLASIGGLADVLFGGSLPSGILPV